MAKVVEIKSEGIVFDNGSELESRHKSDCCEHHYLDFSGVELKDFDGLEFNLAGEGFFEKVDGYGIRLIPVTGHPVSIAGYGSNNGYYSSNLALVLTNGKDKRFFDISDCQVITN